MAGLILCKSKKARSPYCIESTGVRVYTLEELCYYLYYNIHLLGSSWINEKLLVWLNEELTLRKLAEDLEQVMKKGGSLKEMISLIMKESSYFTEKEEKKLCEMIEKLGSKSVLEREKVRADSLLAHHSYQKAVASYETILRSRDDSLGKEFYGDIWHNRGVAFARSFAFKEALESFRKAFEMNGREESLKQYLYALRQCEKEEVNQILFADAEDEALLAVEKELEELKEKVRRQEDIRKLDDFLGKIKEEKYLDKDSREEVKKLILKWKKRYMEEMN